MPVNDFSVVFRLFAKDESENYVKYLFDGKPKPMYVILTGNCLYFRLMTVCW